MSKPEEVRNIECTLEASQLDDRVLEWSDLGRRATAIELVSGGIACTFPSPLAEAVEDLASRERECCGTWLQIVTEQHGEEIRVSITADSADGVAAIRSLAGLTASEHRS